MKKQNVLDFPTTNDAYIKLSSNLQAELALLEHAPKKVMMLFYDKEENFWIKQKGISKMEALWMLENAKKIVLED